jgi:hypothetical protein
MWKVNAETYVQLFTEFPNDEMILSGWEWNIFYFLGIIPVIIYKKKLTK